jgi:hypothetical protein
MPEGMNLEVAHRLSEQERADRTRRRWQEVLEILEVLVLVAVGQRFAVRGVRIGVNTLAVGLLLYGLAAVATLPRL